MSYLILIGSLLLIGLLVFCKNSILENSDLKGTKRLVPLLKFVRIAPLIALGIIIILLLTYFKSKFSIRLSHAWLTLQFWMFSAIFYYCISILRNVNRTILPLIAFIITIAIATYITPLNHFEALFKQMNTTIPNLVGLLMLFTSYRITGYFLKIEIK